MSDWEKAKANIAKIMNELNQHEDSEEESKEWLGYLEHGIQAADQEIQRLRELILHIWVHDGYENCGYRQMTTPQKALYDEIIDLNKEATE